MINIFQYDFLFNSIIAIIFLSILSGIVGSYVTLNRISYLTGGISHSSFAGIGIGYFIGGNPFLGGVIGAIVSALFHSFFTEKMKERSDSIISMMWSLGMALGIIFAELTPGYKPNLMSFLFGDILAVADNYLISLAIMTLFLFVFFALFYNKIILTSFDEEFAKINNINVWLYKTVLLVLSSITIILLTKVSGLILVVALITIPVTIANIIFKKIKFIVFFAIIVALFVQLLGLYLSFLFNISTGPVIIVAMVILYIIVVLAKQLKKRVIND